MTFIPLWNGASAQRLGMHMYDTTYLIV